MQKLKKPIYALAFISLIAAYIFGYQIRGSADQQLLEEAFPGKMITRVGQSSSLFEIKSDSELILIESAQGWGGPFKAALVINSSAELERLVVLRHNETPSFFQHVMDRGFFDQFLDKKLTDKFTSDDIDMISSATISSKAFTKAARNGAYEIGNNHFGLNIAPYKEPWQFGQKESILIALYALVLVALFFKFNKARIVILGISIVFLGFSVNRPISISNIGAIFLGFTPSLHEQPFWWLLVVGVLLLTLILGKNFYCFWMCPFGGLQEYITKLGGAKFGPSKKLAKKLMQLVYLLTWFALMVILLTSNPSMGNFEPFAVLFSLKGLGVQWYLVSLTLLAAFFIPRFWCRFFCPVGVVLQIAAKTKMKLRSGFTSLSAHIRG